ncbi:GH25 family lysozyme [Rothia nasimurium]|uniref:GH25 family lysozyme n=1 Tax=Rothia nasimurium TaxID=85336 RepID=UPI001F1F06DE|nr:GH25 family lysozyme [Rothia nasimurium]
MSTQFGWKAGVLTALVVLSCSFLSPVPATAVEGESSPAAGVASVRPSPEGQIPYGEAKMGAGAYEVLEDGSVSSFGRAAANPVPTLPGGLGVYGMDVSSHQKTVDWSQNYADGSRFAIVKATESNWYVNPRQKEQYDGAGSVGMLRGVYHFAVPSDSSGAEQARYFVANSQKWTQDGKTLPGMLDLEWNPYLSDGDICFDMTPAQLTAWAKEFAATYRQLTGRYPLLYTATGWVNSCLNGSLTELSFMPLHLARYQPTVGPMPVGYSTYDLWQFSDSGPYAGDSNVFNGTMDDLKRLALNPRYRPLGATSSTATRGLYTLKGGIGGFYLQNYRALKQPLTNEYGVQLGGVAQAFDNGYHVYWHPGTGAHSIYWRGAIGDRFAQTGYETGWGFPLTEDRPMSYGAEQIFRHPSGKNTAVYWSNYTGLHTMVAWGGIDGHWNKNTARYGFPITDEVAVGSGAVVRFEKGESLYWAPNTGTTAVVTGGALRDAWVRAGYHQQLGFPIHDERREADGNMHLRLSSGAHFVWNERQGTRRLK